MKRLIPLALMLAGMAGAAVSNRADLRVPLPPGLEGGDLTDLFRGGKGPVVRAREEIVFHFPHYQGDTPHSAILLKNFKLLHFYETGQNLLFDLDQDLLEANDLAAEEPAVTAALAGKLTAYLTAVHAALPAPNPAFDPGKAPPVRKGGGKGGGRMQHVARSGNGDVFVRVRSERRVNPRDIPFQSRTTSDFPGVIRRPLFEDDDLPLSLLPLPPRGARAFLLLHPDAGGGQCLDLPPPQRGGLPHGSTGCGDRFDSAPAA